MKYTCKIAITFESNKGTTYGVVKENTKESQGNSILSIMSFIKNNGLVEGDELISEMYDNFEKEARVYYTGVKSDEKHAWEYNAEYNKKEGTYLIEARIIAK